MLIIISWIAGAPVIILEWTSFGELAFLFLRCISVKLNTLPAHHLRSCALHQPRSSACRAMRWRFSIRATTKNPKWGIRHLREQNLWTLRYVVGKKWKTLNTSSTSEKKKKKQRNIALEENKGEMRATISAAHCSWRLSGSHGNSFLSLYFLSYSPVSDWHLVSCAKNSH